MTYIDFARNLTRVSLGLAAFTIVLAIVAVLSRDRRFVTPARRPQMASPPTVILVSHLRETDDRPGTEKLVEVAHEKHGIEKDHTIALVKESFESAEELAKLFV